MPQVFFQAVLVYLAHLGPQLYSKGSCVRITHWHRYRVEIMKCKKGETAKLYIGSDQFSQGDPGLCWGLFGFSWSLIWHFMNSGTTAKLDASHHAVVLLLRLGAILVLPLARMPLLKLHWQRATSVLPSCVCYLAHLGPHHYSKGSCVRITILAQVPSRDHAVQKRWSYEVVGSDQFSQGDPGLCWGLFGFNWYCWFGISWPLAHLSSSTPAVMQW